jgi:cytochrome oxidase Cu insertion factor (SCO1/SenC/PrrC family)
MRRVLPLLLALLSFLLPAVAVADGDPGSDVLIYQSLFYGADDNVSPVQELRLGKLLSATITLHAPVRVAVIGRRDDLGTVTPLWERPAAYARYLGTELELAYSGRLVVVMPSGVAFFWFDHGSGALIGIRSGRSSAQLVSAADAAVTTLEASAGISGSELADATHGSSVNRTTPGTAMPSAHTSGDSGATATATESGAEAGAGGSDALPGLVIVGIGLVVVLSARFWAPPLWRRRTLVEGSGIAAGGLAIGVLAVAALVGLAVVIHEDGPGTAGANPLNTNPYVDPGSSLSPPKVAPDFTLTDETGQRISLSQYRGKVVILSFIDDECRTICPLTTQAMVDARDSLGHAAKDVQLLAVNANWRSTQVDDVLSYSELHGLVGQWHFLTGSRTQLQHVWKAYGVGDDASSTSNVIAHTPTLEIIDPLGRLRKVYTTQSSYGAIGQFGQVLAHEASALLPGHPPVQTHYSYQPVKGISPSMPSTLRRVGGGAVTLGTGRPHLYLFFATWDQQSTPIKSEMERLNVYARAARR